MNNLLHLLRETGSVNSVSSVLKNPASDVPNVDDLVNTLEELDLQAEHAQAMADHSPNVFLKAAMNIAAMDMFTVLNRFDTVTLTKRLEEKPELYFQLLNSQFNLMKAHLDQQKFEFKQKQAEARQRNRDQKLRARKPILITAATLNTFAQTLNGSRRREEGHAPVSVSPASSIKHPASKTANTGVSQFLELNAQERIRGLENHGSFDDDCWRDIVHEHSAELAPSPS